MKCGTEEVNYIFRVEQYGGLCDGSDKKVGFFFLGGGGVIRVNCGGFGEQVVKCKMWILERKENG